MKKLLLFCASALAALSATAFTPVQGKPYALRATNATESDLYLNFTTTTTNSENTVVLALSPQPSCVYFVADAAHEGQWFIKDAPSSESRLFVSGGVVGKYVYFGTGSTDKNESWTLNPVNSVDNHVTLYTSGSNYAIGSAGTYESGAALWGNNQGANAIIWEITPFDFDIAVTRQNFKCSRTGSDGHYPWGTRLLNTIHTDKAQLKVCHDSGSGNQVNLPCVDSPSHSHPCGSTYDNLEAGATKVVELWAGGSDSRTYTTAVINDDATHYISKYTFKAVPTASGTHIKIGNIVDEDIPDDGKVYGPFTSTVSDNGFVMTISYPDNTKSVKLEEFVITISKKPTTLSRYDAEAMLATHIETVKAKFRNYINNIDDSELAPLFAGITLTDGLDDYTDELASKMTEADAVVSVSTLTSLLNGKKVMIYDHSETVQYLNANGGADLTRAGAGTLPFTFVWQISANDGKINIKNLAYDTYIAGPVNFNASANNNLVHVDAANPVDYVIANIAIYDGYFALQNPALSGSYQYLNTNQSPSKVRYFTAGSGNTSSFFRAAIVTEAQEQAWIDAAKANCNFTMGDGLGEFSVDNATAALVAAVKKMTTENIDYTSLLAAGSVTASLNAVEKGRMIRITDRDGNALVMTAEGPAFVAAPAGNDIFYYTPSGKLMNMAHGNYMATTGAAGHETLNSATTAAHHVAEDPEAAAATVNIATTTTAADASIRGRYHVVCGTNRDLYNSSGTIAAGTGASESNGAHAGYFFNVDYVDALPVQFHADNYGSIISPVDVKVPEEVASGIAIYQLSIREFTTAEGVTEYNVKFDEKDELDVIPAGSTILVYNATGHDFSLPVTYASASETQASTHPRMAGHHLTKKMMVPQGTSLYAKIAVTSAGENGASLLKVNAREASAPEFALVRLLPDAEGYVTTPAGSMVTVVDYPAVGEPADIIKASPSVEMPTAIEEVNADIHATRGCIFDIQGRRLTAPAKGINIIGGRKVVVK